MPPTDQPGSAACRCPDCGSFDVSSLGGGVDRCASCGTTWPHPSVADCSCVETGSGGCPLHDPTIPQLPADPRTSAARCTYSVLVDGRIDGDKHVCSLPGVRGEGTGDYHHVPNTVVRCNGCKRLYVWSYSSTDDNGYSDGWGWERLSSWRPAHRKARRFLREKDSR